MLQSIGKKTNLFGYYSVYKQQIERYMTYLQMNSTKFRENKYQMKAK